MADPATPDRPLNTLAERLTYLFDTVHPPGRHRYTFREVAAAINQNRGEQLISSAYVHHLYTGARDNPGTKQLLALAGFFGVPSTFLTGEADTSTIATQLACLKDLSDLQDALADPGVKLLALKARGLSAPHLRLILRMLEEVRALETTEHPSRPKDFCPEATFSAVRWGL